MTVTVESRLPHSVVTELAQLGVLVKPLPAYDYHIGTHQMSWRAAMAAFVRRLGRAGMDWLADSEGR